MSKPKHTSGPWWLQPNDRNSKRLNGEAKGIDTKSIGVIWHGNEEEEANAHLILAAPAMLALLKLIQKHGLFRMDMKAECDEVIAKAEGR